MNTKKWIEENFNENWKEIKTDIDFSNYECISTCESLHIYEERYEIKGKIYRLLYAIGSVTEPLIEELIS